MKIKGTITHVRIAGGFWGIQADDGRKFRPVNGIPAEFQQEGLQVNAELEPSDKLSLYMWGDEVVLKHLRPAPSDN